MIIGSTDYHRANVPGFLNRAPAFFICPMSSTPVPLFTSLVAETLPHQLVLLMGFGVDSSDHPIYLRFKRGEGRTNAQAFPPQMNISPATVYPDVDAAAHVWATAAPIDEDSDSWFKELITNYCDKPLSTLRDDSFSNSYKIGYAETYFKAIKRLVARRYPTKD
jgi:hypothetical protein